MTLSPCPKCGNPNPDTIKAPPPHATTQWHPHIICPTLGCAHLKAAETLSAAQDRWENER